MFDFVTKECLQDEQAKIFAAVSACTALVRDEKSNFSKDHAQTLRSMIDKFPESLKATLQDKDGDWISDVSGTVYRSEQLQARIDERNQLDTLFPQIFAFG